MLLTNELNLKVCDPAVIESLAVGDVALMKEIMKLFIKQSPDEIKKIKNAIAFNDVVGIQTVAHKMKSCASLVGVTKMHNILQEMEKSAQTDFEVAKMIVLFKDLSEIHELAIYELKRLLVHL